MFFHCSLKGSFCHFITAVAIASEMRFGVSSCELSRLSSMILDAPLWKILISFDLMGTRMDVIFAREKKNKQMGEEREMKKIDKFNCFFFLSPIYADKSLTT